MKTVLVVEDNEDNIELITFILEQHGLETIRARCGQEALDLATRTRPEMILLDIQLPDMPGTDVLRRLKEQEATRAIPVIAVTSYAMAGDRQRLLAAGGDGYIEKPIDPATFMEQILRTCP